MGQKKMAETFNHGYALLIGVGESQYAKLSLPVTVKDTQAIYGVLTDRNLCGYPPEQIRVLNNRHLHNTIKSKKMLQSKKSNRSKS